MRVTAVTTEQHYSGILVPDLDSVKRALYAHANGVSSASNATRAQQPGTAVMLLDMMPQPSGNSFVDSLFADIEGALSMIPDFYRSFEYDGPGRFLKTDIKVSKVENGYTVGINAAYVGHQPEVDIADHLGAIRGLQRSTVLVTLDAARDDQFVIDLKPIMDALVNSVFVVQNVDKIASAIAAGQKEEFTSLIHKGGVVRFFELNHFAASVEIDGYSVGSYIEHPYVADGSVITGRLRKAWDESEFKQPVLRFNVDHLPKDSKGILDPVVQAHVVSLTNDLAFLLSTLIEEVAGTSG